MHRQFWFVSDQTTEQLLMLTRLRIDQFEYTLPSVPRYTVRLFNVDSALPAVWAGRVKSVALGHYQAVARVKAEVGDL